MRSQFSGSSKEIGEYMSALENAGRDIVSTCGKLPARMMKQKKADVETEMRQACIALNAQSERVKKLEAYAW